MKKMSFFYGIMILLFCFQNPVIAQEKGVLEGEIINGTTGGTGKADKITLFVLSMGMKNIKTIENIEGKFRIDDIDTDLNMSYLLQVVYKDVTYSSSFKFNEKGEASINITVFDKTDSREKISVLFQHMIIKLVNDELIIDKLFEIINNKKPEKVFYSDDFTFRFFIPPDVKKIIRAAVSTGTLSTNQKYSRTDEKDIYGISYPIKPGNTRIGVSYAVDYSEKKYKYSERVINDIDNLSVIVSPANIGIESEMLKFSGENTADHYKIYNVENIKEGTELQFDISGGIGEESKESTKHRVTSVHVFSNKVTFFIIAFLSILIIIGISLRKFLYNKNK